MGKTLKIAAVVAVLLLVAWFALPERDRAPERATRHAASPAADAERKPDTPAAADAAGEPDAAPPPGEDGSAAAESAWQEYDSMRALGRMNKRMRGLREQMRGLGASEEPAPDVQPDPTTNAGIFEPGFVPTGLYIEEGDEIIADLNTRVARAEGLNQ